MNKALLMLCVWLVACAGTETPEQASVARGIFPLRTVSSSGKSYQLRGMLEVHDFMTGRIMNVPLDGMDASVVIELGPDRNELRLLDSWVLEDVSSMAPQPVAAKLVSENPMTVYGTPGLVSYIPIRFLLGGEVLLSAQSSSSGQVSVQVAERQPLDSLCATGDACLGGIAPIGPNYAAPAPTYDPRELPFGLTFNIQSEVQEPTRLRIAASDGKLRWDTSVTGPWQPMELGALNELSASLQNRVFDVVLERFDNRTMLLINVPGQNGSAWFTISARLASAPGQTGGAPQLADASGAVEFSSFCGTTFCLPSQPDRLGPAVFDIR